MNTEFWFRFRFYVFTSLFRSGWILRVISACQFQFEFVQFEFGSLPIPIASQLRRGLRQPVCGVTAIPQTSPSFRRLAADDFFFRRRGQIGTSRRCRQIRPPGVDTCSPPEPNERTTHLRHTCHWLRRSTPTGSTSLRSMIPRTTTIECCRHDHNNVIAWVRLVGLSLQFSQNTRKEGPVIQVHLEKFAIFGQYIRRENFDDVHLFRRGLT